MRALGNSDVESGSVVSPFRVSVTLSKSKEDKLPLAVTAKTPELLRLMEPAVLNDEACATVVVRVIPSLMVRLPKLDKLTLFKLTLAPAVMP